MAGVGLDRTDTLDNGTTMLSQVQALRRPYRRRRHHLLRGAAGQEPAAHLSDAASLKAVYQQVVDATRRNPWISTSKAVPWRIRPPSARRNKALVALKRPIPG